MKKFLSIFFVVFLGISFATAAEDLGELAKKEKQRREALAKQGKKVKTFTNADVKNLKSDLGIEVISSGEATGSTAGVKASESPATEAVPAEQKTKADVDAEIERLEKEKEELLQEGKDARENVEKGGVLFTPNVGSQYQQAREAEEAAADAQEEIDELKKEKEEPQKEEQ